MINNFASTSYGDNKELLIQDFLDNIEMYSINLPKNNIHWNIYDMHPCKPYKKGSEYEDVIENMSYNWNIVIIECVENPHIFMNHKKYWFVCTYDTIYDKPIINIEQIDSQYCWKSDEYTYDDVAKIADSFSDSLDRKLEREEKEYWEQKNWEQECFDREHFYGGRSNYEDENW